MHMNAHSAQQTTRTDVSAEVAALVTNDYHGMRKATARNLRGQIHSMLLDTTAQLTRWERHVLRVELHQLSVVS